TVVRVRSPRLVSAQRSQMNNPAVVLAKPRDAMLGHQKGPTHVGRENVVPRLDGDFLKASRSEHACVVDPNVQPAHGLGRLAPGQSHTFLLAHIAWHDQAFATALVN